MFQSRTTRQGKWLVTCAGNVSSILVHDLIPCVFQAEQLSLGFGEHKILTFDLCRLGMWYVCVQTLCGMYVSKRFVVCMCPNAVWYVCVQTLCGTYVSKRYVVRMCPVAMWYVCGPNASAFVVRQRLWSEFYLQYVMFNAV